MSDEVGEPAPPKPRYYCGGAKRVNEDTGKKFCEYKAYSRWYGYCPKCRMPYDCLKLKGADDKKSSETNFAAATSKSSEKRLSTGIAELDEQLAGGFCFGTTVLWAGPPRSGKTTVTMQIANNVATEKHPAIFATKEQTANAILETAIRIKCRNPHVVLRGNEGNIDTITERVKEIKPSLLVCDSVQKIAYASMMSPLDVVTHFIELSRSQNIVIILIAQVKGDSDIAGGKGLEHDVDTVIYMGDWDPEDDKLRLREGRKIDDEADYRFLVLEKNRDSLDGGSILFRMYQAGCTVVRKRRSPSLLFLIKDKDDAGDEGEEGRD